MYDFNISIKKKIENKETSFELTTEIIIVRALERGLTLSDFEHLTLGMIIGIIATHNNLNSGEDKESSVRVADQNDFDNF